MRSRTVAAAVVAFCLAAAPSLAAGAKPAAAPSADKPAAAAAAIRPPALAPANGGTLSGRVTGPDGKPASGATVRVIAVEKDKPAGRMRPGRVDPPKPVAARAGADGTFKLDGLTGSSFTVRVEAKGAAPAFADKVPAGASLDLRLKAGLPVVGRVLDLTTQKPVAGASVRALEHDAAAFGPEAAHAATTGDDGTFTIPDCATGVVSLEATAPGSARARLDGVVVKRVDPDAPPKPAANTLYLGPGGRLAGRVVGSDGKPVADAIVAATAAEGAVFAMMREAPASQRTDATGRFEFDGLPAGKRWTIHARKAGFADADGPPLPVEPGTDRSDLELKLEIGTTMTFRLLTADDVPVTDVQVSLRPSGAGGPGGGARRGRSFAGANGVEVGDDRVVAASDGRITVKNLEAGAFDVTLSPPDYADIVKEGVRLRAGETADLGTLRVKESKSISGRLSDASGGPVAGATIATFWFDGTAAHSRQARSKEDGRYKLAGLGDQPLRDIWVNADGYASARREGAVPGDTAVDFTLDRLGSIAGKVLLPDGSAPPAFRVEAHAEAKEGQERMGMRVLVGTGAGGADQVFTDPSGNFRLDNVSPGKTTIEVRAQGLAPGRKTGIDVRPDQVADAGTIALENGRALRGRVLASKDEAPIAGASVTLTQPQGFVMRMGADAADGLAVSTLDGTFEIDGLEPRSYAVAASQPDYSPASGRVEIPADQDVTDFVIHMSKGGVLTGLVRDAQKVPVPNVQVLIAKMPMSGGPQTAGTGGDGRYTFDKLPPGDYIVMKAPAPGQPLTLMSGMKQATVREGETTEFDLDDAAAINLTGRVLRAGQPVPNAVLMFSFGTTDAGSPVDLKTSKTDEGGRYQVALDKPGSYAVVVSTGGFMGGAASAIPIQVPDDPNPVVDINAKAAAITGRVTGPDGKPVSGAIVSASGAAAEGGGAHQFRDASEPDGGYRIDGVEPGSYRVTVAAPGFRNAENPSVAVAADKETSGIDFSLEPARSLKGHVIDAGGRGIAGAMVVVAATGTITSGRETLPTTSDVNGAFVLTVPVDGPLDLTAVAPGYPPARATGVVPADDLDVAVQAPQGGRVRVVAMGSDGKPVAGAAVGCVAVPDFLGASFSSFMNRPPATGADGVSVVGPLDAGSYECTVGLGTRKVSKAVTVGDGAQSDLPVVLP